MEEVKKKIQALQRHADEADERAQRIQGEFNHEREEREKVRLFNPFYGFHFLFIFYCVGHSELLTLPSK